MSEALQAYRTLPLPLPQFARRYLGPLAVAGGGTLLVVQLALAPSLDPGLALAATLLLGGLFAMLALLMPLLLRDRRRVLIDHRMHFYITHLGVLSTSNLPRNELLRTVSQRREYGPLAEETGRILELVERWNVALPQACLIVAKSTPSKLFADFLERMAHILESSGDMEGFLRSEQGVVLKEYASVYQGAMYGVENLKDLYLSLMMSGIFMAVFGLVMPQLTGADANALIPTVLLAVLLMEGLMVVVMQFRAPPDRLWTDSDVRTRERAAVLHAVPLAVGLAAVALAGLWFLAPVPKALALGLGFTPLLLAGLPAMRVEGLIRRREANYPAFLRSLGAAVAARGGGAAPVLKRLARNDFGPLTPLIKNLHKRLGLRLDEPLAWRYFSAETGSRLVNEFSDMFVEAVRAGGKPDAVAAIISDNVLQLDALRRGRGQAAASMRGMLLGFTAAMAFTLFVGLEVVGVLGGLLGNLPPMNLDVGVGLSLGAPVDVPAVRMLLLGLLVAHAGLAAAMAKILDGGTWVAGLAFFVATLWVGVLAGEASTAMLGALFRPDGGS